MNRSRRHSGLLPRLTLLVFLVLAHGLVVAHEIDHWAAGETNLCAVCSIGHGLDSAAIAGQPTPLAEAADLAPEPYAARAC
ncbi:MAG: hypothetical protein ACSLE2_01500, partial [Lysobacterales bacterium]